MERSLGADALLNESWTIPWLDEEIFPYWTQAARIGDLENFLRWLVVQDTRRAELILNHAREFERVHRLVTTELSKLEQQHQQRQRHRRVQPASPLASAAAERPSTREEEVRGVYPSRNNMAEAAAAAAVPSSSPREPPAAGRSKRPSSRSSGIGIGIGIGNGNGGGRERAAVATNTPFGMNRSGPPPPASTGAGKKKQHGARYSRHEDASGSPPSPLSLVRLSGSNSRRSPSSRPRATRQPPTWSSSPLSAAAPFKSAVVTVPKSRRATRQWNSLGAAQGSGGVGCRSSGGGGGGGGGVSANNNGLGDGSGRGTSHDSGRGDVDGSSRGSKAIDAGAYWPGASGARPAPSSSGAMAVAAVAAAAAGRTAAVRLVVEAAAAEAEAEEAEAAATATAAAKAARAERGKKSGHRGPCPDREKHPSGWAGAGAAGGGLPRRSSPPIAWGQTNGDGTNNHDVKGARAAPARRPVQCKSTLLGAGFVASAPGPGLGFGELFSPPQASDDLPRAGSRSRSPRGPVGRRSAEESIRFPSSPPRLRDIDEERAEQPVEVEEAAEAAAAIAGEKEDGESWLSMRDPVTLREFRFDPETRAAEWEGGEVMGDVPGGMGLGLLSQEDRERLKGKFERRKRRARRSSGGGGGVGAGAGGGHPRGTPGLRAQVLRKLALAREDGDAGAARAAGAAPAVPAQRGGAATA